VPKELVREFGEAVCSACRRPVFDLEILALDVAKLTQAAPQGVEICSISVGWHGLQHADAVEAVALRECCERPDRRAAQQPESGTPPYSIAPSSAATIVAGMKRP
jgi:hypothetical protein